MVAKCCLSVGPIPPCPFIRLANLSNKEIARAQIGRVTSRIPES